MSNKDNKNYFDKEKSVMLGGIAILLMIYHHLLSNHTWYLPEIGYITHFGFLGKALTEIPAFSGNICVQMFAIISGYALFINPKSYATWKSRLSKLFKFLSVYWIIFGLFMVVGWLNGDELPSGINLLKNMVGLQCKPENSWINVPFAWYVAFYIQFILLCPLLLLWFNKKDWRRDLLGFIIILGLTYFLPKYPRDDIFSEFFQNIHPLVCVVIGLIAAKYQLFCKLHEKALKYFPLLILIGIGFGILYLKYKLPQFNPKGGGNWNYFVTISYSFLAFFFVSLSLEIINRIKTQIVKKILVFLGTLSMYLWFLHGIFFTGSKFLQETVYVSKEPIIILITTLVITLPVAYILYLGNKYITIKISKIINKQLLVST